jgi:hypothetical protein
MLLKSAEHPTRTWLKICLQALSSSLLLLLWLLLHLEFYVSCGVVFIAAGVGISSDFVVIMIVVVIVIVVLELDRWTDRQPDR